MVTSRAGVSLMGQKLAELLIEKAFCKGANGGVGISPRHALLLTLVMAVAMNCSALPSKFNKVWDEFGVWLTMEPVIVGRDVDQFSD